MAGFRAMHRHPWAAGSLLLCAALALTLGTAGHPASADYATVDSRLKQAVWARTESDSAPQATAVAVRADGRLLVSTSPDQRAARGYRTEGGDLHLVETEQTTLGPSNRLGPSRFGFHRMVVRKGRLYGLSVTANPVDEVGQKARLIELDLRTGAVLRDLGVWWWPDLAVDPATEDLVLYAFDCTGRCEGDSEQPGRVTHPLVRFDPDTGRRATIIPDRHELPRDGGSPCGTDSPLHRCEDPFRVTMAPDGSAVVLASTRTGGNIVEIRERDGALRRRFDLPRPADAIAIAPAPSCLAGDLFVTTFDGSVLSVAGVLRGGSGARLLASGAPAGSTSIALTPDASAVVSRRSEVGRLSCPGVPPLPTAAKPAAAAAAAPAQHVGPASAAGPQAGPAPGSPGSGAGGPAAPPPATPSAPAPVAAGPPAHAVQAVTSPVGALADAPEEQPVYGLSASTASLASPGWATLGAGALLLAAGAWLAMERSHRPQVRLARQDHSR